jgi:transcription initiation factor TFIID subunit 2
VRLNGTPVGFRYKSPLDDVEPLRSLAERIYPPPSLEELEVMAARQARHAAHGELQVLVPWSTLLARASARTLINDHEDVEAAHPGSHSAPEIASGTTASPVVVATDSEGILPITSGAVPSSMRLRIPGFDGNATKDARTKPQGGLASVLDVFLEVEYATLSNSPAVHFVRSRDAEATGAIAGEKEQTETLLTHNQWDARLSPLPIQVDHVFVESHSGLASCWMPCLNPPNAILANSMARCPYELEIVVPTGMIVVASGELKNSILEQHMASGMTSRTRFFFQIAEGVLASEIAFSAGYFRVLPDRVRPQAVTYFCLPGFVRQLVNTVDFLPAAMDFLEHYFGVPCPCPSTKFVFVDGALTHLPQVYAGGGLVVLSSMLLFSDRVVDDVFSSHQRMVTALVALWSRRLLRPAHMADLWLFVGIEEYMGALCLRKLFGNTWFRLHLRDAMKAVVESPGCLRWSVVEQPAAEWHEQSRRFAMLLVSAIDRRAERKLEQSHLAASRKHHPNRLDVGEGIRSVLHGLMVAPPRNRAIGLKPFLRLLERKAGIELLTFVRQYVSSNSLPIFQCGYRYDAKEHKIELAVKQSVHRRMNGSSSEPIVFRGTLRFGIREPEEHYHVDLEITESVHVFDVYCRTRKVGLGVRGRAAASSADHLQKSAERPALSHDPILWIRVDPDMEWVRGVFWRQQERAWIRQLAGERDVLSQLDCCDALYLHASTHGVRGLSEHALENEQVHYRVRGAAAASIARWGGSETRFLGLEILLNFYADRYLASETDVLPSAAGPSDQHAGADPQEPLSKKGASTGEQDQSLFQSKRRFQCQRLPKPLDFGKNLAEYFLQRAVLRALGNVRVSQSRDGISRTPTDVFALLDQVLRFHNNESNLFEDAYFLPDALLAFASAASTNEGFRATEVYRCLQRYLSRDRLFPSHQLALTAGCIDAWAELVAVHQQFAERGEHNSEWIRIQTELENLIWNILLGPAAEVSEKLHDPAVQTLLNEYFAHTWWLHRPFRAAVDGIVRTAGDRPEVVEALMATAGALPQPLYPLLVFQGMGKYATRTTKLATLLRSGHEMAARTVRETLRLYGCCRHPVVRQAMAEFFRAMWGYGEPAPLLTSDEYRRRLNSRSLTVHLNGSALGSVASVPSAEHSTSLRLPSEGLETPLIIRVQTTDASKEGLDTNPAESNVGIKPFSDESGDTSAATAAASTEPILVLRLPAIADPSEPDPQLDLDDEDQVYVDYVRSSILARNPG